MQKHIDTLKELIKNKTSWNDLKIKLSVYNQHDSANSVKTTIAGSLFEVFTKYYFKTMPSERDNYREVYFYKDIPLSIKEKLDLTTTDYGIDILLEDHNGRYLAVQCKFKNDETTRLNWSRDKIANLFAFCPKADGYMVFTNCSELDDVSKTRSDKFSFYNISDLLQMDAENFSNIYRSMIGEEMKHIPKVPFPHQTAAIDACLVHFKKESRGQLILPCAAGKTLTALWIKEKLKSNNTLVLVPSLALLKQIKNDWAKDKNDPYHYLCVCSETDIDSDRKKDSDTLIHHPYEIGVNVTTIPETIQNFLSQSNPKVIFSTYQSLSAINTAIEGTDIKFDFVFCDEAHKTAGIGENTFSLIHNDEKIPAVIRLYATATPRIVSDKIKKQMQDDFIYAYDMSDAAVFGKEIYRMSFKEAIEDNILVDYQIVAIGVNDEKIKKFIDERRFAIGSISMDEAANNYALEFVMDQYKASHALTFHSRVKVAEEFAKRHNDLFKDFQSFAISGAQSTSRRNIILNEFKQLKKSVISNARCLTEGVDVPAIDLVYFCDPKNSKVDIVQAVGRALRKKEGKTMGYVVVPIYHSDKNSIDQVIDSSVFTNLIQVIRSLCDHDERLQVEINNLSRGKGERNSNNRRIVNLSMKEETEPIVLLGFEEQLKKSLFNQIISKVSSRWDIRYLELIEYREANPERWPVYDKKESETKESKLGIFCEVIRQQYQRNKLSESWKIKMGELNFNFNGKDDNWFARYEEVKKKIIDFESIAAGAIGKKNHNWVMRHWKEYNNKELDSTKSERIAELNLERFFPSWDEKYAEIVNWKNGNGRLPTKNSNKKLNDWLVSERNKHRRNNSYFSKEQKEKLQDLGYDINIVGNKGDLEKWSKHFNLLVVFRQTNSSKWPNSSVEDEKKLFNWCQAQRQRQAGTASKGQTNRLEDWKVKKLDEIGFMWDGDEQKEIDWLINYNKVKSLLEEPDSDNFKIKVAGKFHPLYSWINTQKSAFKKGKLSEERIQLLSKINIDVASKNRLLDVKRVVI